MANQYRAVEVERGNYTSGIGGEPCYAIAAIRLFRRAMTALVDGDDCVVFDKSASNCVNIAAVCDQPKARTMGLP